MSENASVGIVFSTVSGMLRSIVIPDTAQEHAIHRKGINSGETYLVTDLPTVDEPDGSTSISLTDIEAAITKITGKLVPPPERGVILDQEGIVIAVALIDSNIDPGLSKTLTVVVDDVAEVGWAVTSEGALAPAEEVVAAALVA